MRLFNLRAGWMTEGMLITILAKDKPVDNTCMASYYGLQPGDRHYDELQRPCRYTRTVLMKPNGSFTVVPMTPHTKVMPE